MITVLKRSMCDRRLRCALYRASAQLPL